MKEYPLYRFLVKFWQIPLLGALLFSFLSGVLVVNDYPYAVCIISIMITFLLLLLQIYILVVATIKQAWNTAIGFLITISISTIGSLFLFGISIVANRTTNTYKQKATSADTTMIHVEHPTTNCSNQGMPFPQTSR